MEKAAKEDLLADGGDDHGGENDCRKGRGERHGGAQLGNLEFVADADAPVVGRGAVNRHADGVDRKPGTGSQQGAEGQRGRAVALLAEANLPPPLRAENNKRQRPHHEELNQEEDARLWRTEDSEEPQGNQQRQHQQ